MESVKISEIMTRNVVCVGPDQKLLDVKHIFEKKDFHHHIPVVENNKLVGMISLIDFMYKIKGAGLDDADQVYSTLCAKDIMTVHPFSKGPDTTVEEIAKELSRGRYRAIPIVKQKEVVGIVSTADIIKYFLEHSN